jgi:hypothetical protein
VVNFGGQLLGGLFVPNPSHQAVRQRSGGLACEEPSAFVCWCLSPSSGAVTHLVTRLADLGLITWLQTNGTRLRWRWTDNDACHVYGQVSPCGAHSWSYVPWLGSRRPKRLATNAASASRDGCPQPMQNGCPAGSAYTW